MYFYRLTADAACERDRIAFPDASHWAVPGRGLRAPLDRLNDNVRRGLGDNESLCLAIDASMVDLSQLKFQHIGTNSMFLYMQPRTKTQR